jgi:glycosyltransferase involved in cell wall biosynthesis
MSHHSTQLPAVSETRCFDNPELAVVVIALGAPAELLDAVASVLNQSVPVEIVVVNSGGGNASALLKKAGIDIPVYETVERQYIGASRNIGIQNTRAPWISFLASDCLAAPNWAAERLRLHKAGAGMVASAMMPDRPDKLISWAHHLLLFPARLPGLSAIAALRYGVSFDRQLFEIFGFFDSTLRTGEDTEFLSRITTRPEEIWWAPTVVTLHRNAQNVMSVLRDQLVRGYRYALAARRLRGVSPWRLARAALLEPKRARYLAKAGLSGRDLKLALQSLWLVRLGSLAGALGILTACPQTVASETKRIYLGARVSVD